MSRGTVTIRLLLCGLLGLPLLVGCAAFRPMKGIPARYLPDEYRGPSRSGKRTIDLSLLRQTPPKAHLVDAGDLLSIYIEGVLGHNAEQAPVHFPASNDLPPTVGYPVPVREDGTISLPYVGAISVRGLTLSQVEQRLRQAYTVDRQILNPHRERMIVALQRPRTYRITVIRQEAGSDAAVSQGGTLNLGALKRGTGKVVALPVYRNDVLNALAETGGLPGLDAENAIYVIRSGQGPTMHLAEHREPSARRSPSGQDAPLLVKDRTLAEDRGVVVRGQSPYGSRYAPLPADSAAARPWGPPPALTDMAASAGRVQPVAQPMTTWPMPQPDATFSPPPGSSPPTVGAPLSPPPYLPPPQLAPPGIPAAPHAPGWSVPGTPETWSGPPLVGEHGSPRRIIRIPIRLGPGEVADITEEDIILYDGDIVFIESRDTEVFYTGGLLGGGQYSLPRDYDLDVLGAIAIAQGQRSGGGGSPATSSVGGQSALNNDVSISASHLIILRPLPDGSQLPILVDLYEAVRDPAARVIIQPGDYLLLQYTRLEAIAAFVERHLLAGALFSVAAAQLQTGGGN